MDIGLSPSFLVTMNSAAMNTNVQVTYLSPYFQLFGVHTQKWHCLHFCSFKRNPSSFVLWHPTPSSEPKKKKRQNLVGKLKSTMLLKQKATQSWVCPRAQMPVKSYSYRAPGAAAQNPHFLTWCILLSTPGMSIDKRRFCKVQGMQLNSLMKYLNRPLLPGTFMSQC